MSFQELIKMIINVVLVIINLLTFYFEAFTFEISKHQSNLNKA